MQTLIKRYTPGWNSGARSIASISGDGGASWTVGQSIGIVCGLNDFDESAGFTEIDHAFYIASSKYRIIESGSFKTSSSNFSEGDVFRIERLGGTVRYYVDGSLVYTSLKPSEGEVFVDCSLYFYLDSIIGLDVFDIFYCDVEVGFLPMAGVLVESGVEFVRGDIGPLSGSLVLANSSRIEAAISDLKGIILEDGVTIVRGEFAPATGRADEISIIPEYNAVFGVFEPPRGKLFEFAFSGDVSGSFESLVGFLIEDGIGAIRGSFEPFDSTVYTVPQNIVYATWPSWTIDFHGYQDVFALHESLYGSSQSALHFSSYLIGDVRGRLHSTSWSVTSGVLHRSLYEVALASASSSENRLHESLYSVIGVDPATVAIRLHEVSYSVSSLAIISASAIHSVSYSVYVPARRLHESIYKSIVEGHRLHSSSWRVDTDTRFARIHETRYRTSDTSTIIDAGTITVGDGNLRAYDFLDISITADENSPYWQCEMTLKDARDYVRFPRDAPFVIRLFGVDFAFIVDSRTLSRSIDDSGNYLETCTIGGLSPLVAKARPRATRITETWTSPELASSIVESLIGSVTWNLVDWIVPSYRLAAERADPLEVAKQVVTAVGGLIESRPDGTVVCRHLWPTSIAALDSAVPDHSLDERVIYAASESPTQDELVDRVRIHDGEASFQDRLEYVPNKIGENDDPRNGVLYAFVSPWREGLRIVTTRPSKISVGPVSEGTRIVGDDNPDYPAETVTFAERTGSTQYPVMSLTSLDWLDENLGSATVQPYSTTIDAGDGSYGGYSLAKVQYVSRYLSVPVRCVETIEEIEAQFLLLETQDG